jgi:hypothetical protein
LEINLKHTTLAAALHAGVGMVPITKCNSSLGSGDLTQTKDKLCNFKTENKYNNNRFLTKTH